MDVNRAGADLAYPCGPEAAGLFQEQRAPGMHQRTWHKPWQNWGSSRDGYFQWLQVPAAHLDGPVRLTAGETVLRYRKDFADMTHLSAGGSVRSGLAPNVPRASIFTAPQLPLLIWAPLRSWR